MPDTVENLILDLIEWLARAEHTYQETFDAWRTSCPRLTVWEDATERRLIVAVTVNGRTLLRPSAAGMALLKAQRRSTYEQLQELEA